METECLSCIIHRGYLEIVEATKNPELQFKAASALLEYMAKEFKPSAVAAIIGTVRDRIIKQISGNLDIYAQKKRTSNKAALELLPSLKRTHLRINSEKLALPRLLATSLSLTFQNMKLTLTNWND